MAYKRPVRLTNPFITLTTETGTPATIDLTCYARGVHLVPEEDDAAATFCDPLGYMWVLTIDLLQSVGTDGLHDLLMSLGGPGTLVTFDVAFTQDPASAENPHWTGETRLSAWPLIDAGLNEPTEINLEMDVIGDVAEDTGTGSPLAVAMRTTEAVPA